MGSSGKKRKNDNSTTSFSILATKSRRRKRTNSTSSEESDGDEEHEIDTWIGKPFVSERSEKAYSKIRIVDETYCVGDSVYVEVEGHKDYQPLLLKELWEDEDGNKWAYGTWYYLTWELGKGKPRGSLTNEFFESDRGDEFAVLSLRSKIDVVGKETELPDDDSAFICRYFFDPITRNVYPRPSHGEDPLTMTPVVVGNQNSAKKKSPPAKVVAKTDVESAPEPEPENGTHDSGSDDEGDHNADGDIYDRARKMLQLSSVPDSMPCRESERDRIQNFLVNGIKRGGSQLALYISGMPGTGKTATFYEVIRSLNSQQKRGKLPRFKFVEINGLKLPKPEETYSVLAKLILNDNAKMGAAKACHALESYFSTAGSRREVCILLIDEIDQLVTKKQQVLYNIFDWPQSPHARLVVVGIANTMDLPERLLPRIQSRLGEGRIMFAPYNRTQIEQIVRQRLQGIELFDPNAIDFSARKVAGLSGDVRRALQLCRRAVDICKRNGQKKVMIEHINAAVKEIDSKLHCQVIATLNSLEKLFLIFTHKHAKAIREDETVFFQDVYRRLKNAAGMLPEFGTIINDPDSTRAIFLQLMTKLVRIGLLRSDADVRQSGLGPALSLTFDYEDMRIALGSDQLLERVM